MGKWKDRERTGFLETKFVEADFCGETTKFWPVSVGQAVKLRSIGGPLIEALTILFSKNENDSTQISREFTGGADGGGKEVVLQGIAPELAALRTKERATALGKAVETVTSKQNLLVIGEVLMNSLREDFPPGDKDNPPAREFINGLDLQELTQGIKGLIKANMGVFGPFAGKVEETVDQVLGSVVPTPGQT